MDVALTSCVKHSFPSRAIMLAVSFLKEQFQRVVAGDVAGQFDKAFSKLQQVSRLLSKTSDRDVAVFVCGDFLGQDAASFDSYTKGKKKVPVHIYILGAVNEQQAKFFEDKKGNLDICDNLSCLGKFGALTLFEGLTVAFLSGTESKESTSFTFNKDDVDKLIKQCTSYPKIDLLLTYQWPYGVDKVSSTPLPVKKGSKLIGQLVCAIKPRVHFAASEKIAFSTPPMNHRLDGNECRATRFTGFSSFADRKTGKWVTGINFPVDEPDPQPGEVDIPFDYAQEKNNAINPILFDTRSSKKGQKSGHKRPHAPLVVNPEDCWFCLGNSRVDKSLIATIGENAYITLAKGPVCDGHVIVLPIRHIAKLNEDEQVEQEVWMFTMTISDYYRSMGKEFLMIERSYKSPHAQVECLPIDPELVHEGTVEKIITHLAIQKHLVINMLDFDNVHNARKDLLRGSYFYMQVGSKKSARGYLVDIKEGMPFPVNFGREVVVLALDVPHKARWQDCVDDDETVKQKVRAFNEGYRPFNYTVDKGSFPMGVPPRFPC